MKLDLPNIALVATILICCVANEAGCERFFSDEALVHSELRNRLGLDVTNSLMFVRANYEWVMNRIKRTLDDVDGNGEVVL